MNGLEGVMTEKQKLAYSIAHWRVNERIIKETKEILEATTNGFLVLAIDGHRKEIKISPKNCALCRENYSCVTCLIDIKTQVGCVGTPYEDFQEAMENFNIPAAINDKIPCQTP